MVTQFEVNADAVIAGANLIGNIKIPPSIFRNVVRLALEDTFEEAVRYADGDGGFPEEFQDHVMGVVRNYQGYSIETAGASVFINFDFDGLGTHEELTRAYHQGAMLAEGGRLWGPYTGQALKQTDPSERHTFWEAFQEGRSTVQMGNKRVPTTKSGHTWEETKQQYVNIWGEKCPEWLFIQYGQEEWEPTIPSFDIIGEFEQRLYALAETELVYFVETELAIANSYITTGIEVGFTSRGQPRLASPTTTIGGKTYRTGQFVPKNI